MNSGLLFGTLGLLFVLPVHGAHGQQGPDLSGELEPCFDGRGFSVRLDDREWIWGLELASYGFAGRQEEVDTPARVHAQGGRVAYDWDEVLTEWFVNDTRGVEHGYTVHRPPASPSGNELLSLSLEVRGDLVPKIAGNGRDVSFANAEGGAVISYSGLKAWDAAGRVLSAEFEMALGGLRLTVDTRGARYPITIDPVVQRAYIKTSNPDRDDRIASVAISGDTMVIGASGEDSSSSGVNGNQFDNSFSDSGAAYVFVRSAGGWTQQAYLKASNPDAGDRFAAVAVSGDTIAVGAPYEDSDATGINGSQNNDLWGSGAVYIFVRNGTTWTQQAYIKPSNTGQGDAFGAAVALSGDTLVVGAPEEESHATGVNGDEGDNSSMNSGAAYVFRRSGSVWSQQAYLKASNTDALDNFGGSVGLDGNTIVVGAPAEDSSARGVNGDQTNNTGWESGAAYVFVHDGANWVQEAYLKASNTGRNDYFGWTAALSGDTILVGAPGENSSATGVNGDQDDNRARDSGAAYVFVRSGTTWSQEAYLKASNTASNDGFYLVALDGDMAVIGASGEGSVATGVNGSQDDGAPGSGASYVFRRNGSDWRQTEYLKASNTDVGDAFGTATAISNDTAVVLAPGEDSYSAGVNGDQQNNILRDSGAAYVFDLHPTGWFYMGNSLGGAFFDPLLLGSGPLSGGSNNALELTRAMPFAPAGLFVALSSTPVPFKGGLLMPYPWLDVPILQTTSLAGTISLQFTLPASVPANTELWFQWAIMDWSAVAGVALSNAVVGITP